MSSTHSQKSKRSNSMNSCSGNEQSGNQKTYKQYYQTDVQNKENIMKENEMKETTPRLLPTGSLYNSSNQQTTIFQRQQKLVIDPQVDWQGTTETKWKQFQEMDEEEMYISRLKNQREKIDQIQNEFSEKMDYYNSLESRVKELSKYKPYYDKYSQLKSILERTLDKLSRRDTELQNLKEELKRQREQKNTVQDFQVNLISTTKENSKLIEEVRNLTVSNSRLNAQLQEMQQDALVQNQKYLNVNNLLNERFNSAKIESSKIQDNLAHFKLLNEQIIVLRQQKEETILLNKQIQEELVKALEKSNVQQKVIDDNSNEIEILKSKLSEQEYNLVMLNAKNSAELEEQKEKMVKKEISIIEELRHAIRERDEKLMKSRQLNQELSSEFDSAVKRIQEFETEISEYRKENHALKVRLSGQSRLITQDSPQSQWRVKQELDSLEKDIFTFKKNQHNQIESGVTKRTRPEMNEFASNLVDRSPMQNPSSSSTQLYQSSFPLHRPSSYKSNVF